nr:E3 ubiquitin-protein ligase XIAP isoform X2 [Crassostrea gigas]
MSSEDMQNNPSSFDERSFSNQRVAAAESINVSIESSDNVPIEICTDMMPVECSDKMPIQCSEPPQEMTQPPIELVIEEVPQNSESVNLEGNSAQASRASNPIVPVFHLSQSIHDDNRLHQFTERLDTFSCWSSPQRREDMALAGFYYTGCGDRVRCAFCNLQLQEWNIDVEPFSRHMHENPRCPFIEKPTCCMNMTSLIDEEVVEEVLAFGFQWTDVEVAVAKLLSCRCTDEITALEILKYLFQNEKENEIQHVPST